MCDYLQVICPSFAPLRLCPPIDLGLTSYFIRTFCFEISFVNCFSFLLHFRIVINSKMAKSLQNLVAVLICLLVSLDLSSSTSICPRIKSKFCTGIIGLNYDKTFFPNVMGHEDQKEAKVALKPYEELVESGCSPYIHAFLCAAFIPACPVWKDNPKRSVKPCKELCEEARKDCEETLVNELGMSWPEELNCDSFPTYDAERRNPACINFTPVVASQTASPEPVREFSPSSTLTIEVQTSAPAEFAKSTLIGIADGTDAPEGSTTMLVSTETGDYVSQVADIFESTLPSRGESTISTPPEDDSPDMSSSTSAGESEVPADNGLTTTYNPTDSPSTPTGGEGTTRITSTKSITSTEEPDGLPIIRKSPESKDVLAGSSVEFRCIAAGAGEYSWKRVNGNYPDDKVTLEDFDKYKGAVLRMVDLAPEDSGIYSCVASNGKGYVEALFTLSVVIAPTIDLIDSPQYVLEGDRLEVSCSAEGIPPPTIQWERQGGLEVIEKGQGNRRILVIRKASISDIGIYRCIAANQAGVANYSIEIVTESAVEIIEEIQSQIIMESETAFFICKATGSPAPHFVWHKMNGALPDKSRVIIEESNVNNSLGYPIYTSILAIEPALVEDSGVYQCYAYNAIGNYTVLSEITVVGPPGFSQEPEAEQSASEGEFAYFSCMGKGTTPFDITWSKEGDENWPENNDRVDIENENTFVRISNVMKNDAGIYTCVVSNNHGSRRASSNLTVTDRNVSSESTTQRIQLTSDKMDTTQLVSNETIIPDASISTEQDKGDTSVSSSLEPTLVGSAKSGSPKTQVSQERELTPSTESVGLEVSEVTDSRGSSVSTEYQEQIKTDVSTASHRSTEPQKSTQSEIVIESQETIELETSTKLHGSTTHQGSTKPQESTDFHGATKSQSYTEVLGPTELESSTEPRGSTEHRGSTGIQGTSGPQGTAEPRVSTEPHGSPESHGSVKTLNFTEIQRSTESSGSTVPYGSTESHGSTTSRDSTETQRSTEAHESTESEGVTEPKRSTELLESTEPRVSLETSSVSILLTDDLSTTKADTLISKSTNPPQQDVGLKYRRTDITKPGVRGLFQGWVDVQSQGAANDFCRIVEVAENKYQLACSLAGSDGEAEFNYVSQVGFDVGESDTFYMKDEDGDGRDDYCRCSSKPSKRYVWCTKAGSFGFYGSVDAEMEQTNQYSFKAPGKKQELKRCRRRHVDPFFGIPYTRD